MKRLSSNILDVDIEKELQKIINEYNFRQKRKKKRFKKLLQYVDSIK